MILTIRFFLYTIMRTGNRGGYRFFEPALFNTGGSHMLIITKVRVFVLFVLTIIWLTGDSSNQNAIALAKCDVPMFELPTSSSNVMNVNCHYLDDRKSYVVDFFLKKNKFAQGVFKTVFLSNQGYYMEVDDPGASFRQKSLMRRIDVPTLTSFGGNHVYVFEDGIFFMTPPDLVNATIVRIFIYHVRPSMIRLVSKLDSSCDKDKVVKMEFHSICMHVNEL